MNTPAVLTRKHISYQRYEICFLVILECSLNKNKLFDVVAERARVGGDAVLLQMGGDIRKRDRVRFVRGCTEVFEQDKRAIDMRQAFLLVYRFLLCLP